MSNNRYQEMISEIVRAKKTTQTVKKRLEKLEELMSHAAQLLKEAGVRPYVKRDRPPARKRRSNLNSNRALQNHPS